MLQYNILASYTVPILCCVAVAVVSGIYLSTCSTIILIFNDVKTIILIFNDVMLI
jgi:hypothetical protein